VDAPPRQLAGVCDGEGVVREDPRSIAAAAHDGDRRPDRSPWCGGHGGEEEAYGQQAPPKSRDVVPTLNDEHPSRGHEGLHLVRVRRRGPMTSPGVSQLLGLVDRDSQYRERTRYEVGRVVRTSPDVGRPWLPGR